MKTPTSPRMPGVALLLAACLLPFSTGCALTSKSAPISPRYFNPEPEVEARRAPAEKRGDARLELRLGHVDSASHLDERIVYRDSDYELGYYEERRWTEAPEQYLKRQLARVLFEERGLQRVVSGMAPTLEVELVAFDEIRAPKHEARVQVAVRLQDQRMVRWSETFTVDQPITVKQGGDAASAAAQAMGRALRTVVDRIAERTTTVLASNVSGTDASDSKSASQSPSR